MQIVSKEFFHFSKKIAVFAVILWITNFMLGNVVDMLYFSRPNKLVNSIEKAEGDIIVLGSSRAYHHYIPSVIEDSLGISCYNLGFDGQNIYFHYALFNSLLTRYTPKIVILDLISADFIHAPGLNMETIADLYPYYERNEGVNEIVRLPDFNRLKLQLSLLKYNSKMFDIAERWLLTGNEKQSNLKGYSPLKGRIPSKISHDTKESNKTKNNKAPEYDKIKIEYLSKLISLCKSRGIVVLAFLSPCWYYDDNDFAVDSLLADFSVPLFDYRKDERFLLNNDLFRDNTHLNEDGAKLYTDLVVGDIKKHTGVNFSELQKQ